jgi:hypothetical protein
LTTLISQHNSGGLVGRCDAHCHNAKGPRCTCICGGRFHGRGFAQAQQDLTVGTFGELLDEAGKKGVELIAPGIKRAVPA